jgi:hypothetical protein
MAELYNSKINALKMELEHWFRNGGTFAGWEDRKKLGDGTLIPFLENFIEEAYQGRHGMTKDTVRVYNALLKRLKELAAKQGKKDFRFVDIDGNFLNQFWDMLMSQYHPPGTACAIPIISARNCLRAT